MVERSLDWLKQAKRDLENAEYEIRGEFYEYVCFLAQQASEKAVKAVFQKMGVEAFGYSVAGSIKRLSEHFNLDLELIRFAKELDKAYIPTRYPNAHPEGAPYELYTREEAERLVEYGRKIVRFCENLLSQI
ncbi:MAG: HEPN domain-containing protein [Nitrososphaeria archaeon]|nr:HEPN domain-containing protein [Nitrososphaeria archaeon]